MWHCPMRIWTWTMPTIGGMRLGRKNMVPNQLIQLQWIFTVLISSQKFVTFLESRLDASAVAYWIGVALVQLVWATSSGGISTVQSLSFSRSDKWLTCRYHWLLQPCFSRPLDLLWTNLFQENFQEFLQIFADSCAGVWKVPQNLGFGLRSPKQWVWSLGLLVGFPWFACLDVLSLDFYAFRSVTSDTWLV